MFATSDTSEVGHERLGHEPGRGIGRGPGRGIGQPEGHRQAAIEVESPVLFCCVYGTVGGVRRLFGGPGGAAPFGGPSPPRWRPLRWLGGPLGGSALGGSALGTRQGSGSALGGSVDRSGSVDR